MAPKKPRIKWLSVAMAYVDQLGTKGTSRELGERPRAWAQRLAGQSMRLREIRAMGEWWTKPRELTIREIRRRAHRAGRNQS